MSNNCDAYYEGRDDLRDTIRDDLIGWSKWKPMGVLLDDLRAILTRADFIFSDKDWKRVCKHLASEEAATTS